MKIDAHQHFWKYDSQEDGWITDEMAVLRRDFLPENLSGELRANDVDACIAVQATQSESETLFLLDSAERHRFVAGVVGWVDLRADNIRDRLSYFSRFPRLRGFRHIVQWEPDEKFMLREDFLRGIGSLRKFGYTYDILVYPHQLPAAVELAGKFPEQPFVLDHLGKPHVKTGEIQGWAEQIRVLASHPNVYCKLSGLITEADWTHWKPGDFRRYLDLVFEVFGVRRLMFGSDWPVCLLAGSYGRVKQMLEDYTGELSAAEREQIFGGTAARFYRMEGAQHGSAA